MTYHTRLHALQKTIQKNGCDAFFLDDLTNLFYMTGLELSAGKLLVHSKGADLFVDSRYFESCKKKSPFMVRLTEASTFESFLSYPEFSHIQKIGFDSETTTYKNYQLFQNILAKIKRKDRSPELIPFDAPLKLQRTIKDAGEIQTLREAAALGSQGFDFIHQLLKEGITEQECAIELEIFWKRRGSKGVAFDPIIAFGPNSSMPHHRAGNDKLKAGQIVLIDIGVNYKHYHSDMTRIVFFGKPDTRLLAIHAIVQKAQHAALSLCKPGTMIGELDKTARDIIAKYGYADNFTHSLGHGVGLNIHEYPTLRNTPGISETPLKAGMVITIEPGIYLPQTGGVRIEDTIAITEDGYENLTLRNTDPLFV